MQYSFRCYYFFNLVFCVFLWKPRRAIVYAFRIIELLFLSWLLVHPSDVWKVLNQPSITELANYSPVDSLAPKQPQRTPCKFTCIITYFDRTTWFWTKEKNVSVSVQIFLVVFAMNKILKDSKILKRGIFGHYFILWSLNGIKKALWL